MIRQYRLITVERKRDVFCVHLRHRKLEEGEIYSLTEELLSLVTDEGCTKLALSLGPEEPQCLYSVFLARLITLRRRLMEKGGALKICDASPAVVDVFAACQLKDYFDFVPDQKTAIAGFV
jgi:hypothetical protein